MRISRKKRPIKLLIPHFTLNDRINVPEVRVLDTDGENLGVMKLEDALAKAKENEMDLVIINPKGNPPVAKIIDFTHFKYQKEKEARKQKANTHVSDLKGIRLSIRIGEHDMNIRKIQAEKFLNRGDKVKIEVILRGRENSKAHIAFDVINKFIGLIQQGLELRVEQETSKQGNKVTAIVAKK